MAKLLCINSGLHGILNSSYELVNRLQAEGHTVILGTCLNRKEEVELQGFTYEQFPNLYEPIADDSPSGSGILGKLKRFVYRYRHMKNRRFAAVSSLHTNAFLQRINQHRPDVLIIDIELHEFILAAYSQKIPTLLLSPWFSLTNQENTPPLASLAIPGKGIAGSAIGMKLGFVAQAIKRFISVQKANVLTGSVNRRTALLHYAKQIQFPMNSLVHGHWPPPFTHRHFPVLMMNLAELEFSPSRAQQEHYIGPMIYEARKHDETVQANAFFEAANQGEALVYFPLTTMLAANNNILHNFMEAFRSLSHINFIIGLGGKTKVEALGQLTPNIKAFSWVPQLSVLKHASLTINHGGINTINECIHFQVPLLIVPGNRFDQNGCAARIHHHGIGKINPAPHTTKSIITDIEELLSNNAYKQRIQEMNNAYLATKKSNKLQKLITSATHDR